LRCYSVLLFIIPRYTSPYTSEQNWSPNIQGWPHQRTIKKKKWSYGVPNPVYRCHSVESPPRRLDITSWKWFLSQERNLYLWYGGHCIEENELVCWFSDYEAGLCLDQCFESYVTNLQFILVYNKQVKTNLMWNYSKEIFHFPCTAWKLNQLKNSTTKN
jgi:hypothetical protein